jgi:hypothetical protein
VAWCTVAGQSGSGGRRISKGCGIKTWEIGQPPVRLWYISVSAFQRHRLERANQMKTDSSTPGVRSFCLNGDVYLLTKGLLMDDPGVRFRLISYFSYSFL